MEEEVSAILDSKSRRATRSAAIRAKLKHPVIDSDGHALEFGPVYFDFLKQVAGPRIVERFIGQEAVYLIRSRRIGLSCTRLP